MRPVESMTMPLPAAWNDPVPRMLLLGPWTLIDTTPCSTESSTWAMSSLSPASRLLARETAGASALVVLLSLSLAATTPPATAAAIRAPTMPPTSAGFSHPAPPGTLEAGAGGTGGSGFGGLSGGDVGGGPAGGGSSNH